MVRTHSVAIARSAGFALLHPAERPQLDATRILTLSGTLAVNLIAAGLLMLPLSPPPPAPLADDRPDMQWEWLPRTPVTPPPPSVEVPVVRTPVPPRHTAIAPPRQSIASATEPLLVATAETGTEPATAATGESTGPATSIAPATTGPLPVQLQYAHAPAPAYPRAALRSGATGTVMLQVLVGTDGRPLDVVVAKSSGNRDLDSAARNQVLRKWRFRPAMIDGRAVQAIGLVPVEFTLD